MELSLLDADEIYESSGHLQLSRIRISHAALGDFSIRLERFRARLGDATQDDQWKTFLTPLLRYRFTLCSSPVPFNLQGLLTPEIISLLARQLKYCQRLYPDFVGEAGALFESATTLAISNENPLLDAITELGLPPSGTRVGLLLKSSQFIPQVEQLLAQARLSNTFEALTASELKGAAVYSSLVVIGPPGWFPEYIFTAPRADSILSMRFAWIRDTWRPGNRFFGTVHWPSAGGTVTGEAVVDSPERDSGDPSNIDELNILLSINPAQFAIGYSPSGADADNAEPARPIVLAGGWLVFLEADGSSKVGIIDLETGKPRVRTIRGHDLEPGMFLILRTEGGGDYIEDVANRLLGQSAPGARSDQRLWKTRLRAEIANNGIREVSRQLGAFGAKRASVENIRRWMSARSIRTNDFDDFRAIMEFTGLATRAEELWKSMELIDRAHLIAGARIRKMLLQQVSRADTRTLEKLGVMDFELPAEDGGRITAFRVEEVLQQEVVVPAWRVRQPFRSS